MYTVETETDKGLVVVTLLIQARAIRSFSLAWGKIHQVPAGHRPGLKGLNRGKWVILLSYYYSDRPATTGANVGRNYM